MSPRKYPSGYEKKKRQREELIESQKGVMDKFITSKNQNLAENLNEGFINEQEIHQKELEDNENIQQNDNNKGGHDNVQTCRLCLVAIKRFPENTYFPEMLISEKEKYFFVFGCISKNFPENIFWCLEKKKENTNPNKHQP